MPNEWVIAIYLIIILEVCYAVCFVLVFYIFVFALCLF
jgi:hypothetical protein